ncbi:MAG: hypothetical protein CM15mP115_23760 [Alphaproteobacteria bacterium]|nr:MAG: hypothetical protein CM15mP115_23760 [Alphaproteobacteria bacterium]
MLVMGWMFLGEQVGIRRITACAIGFAGTLMIIQPSFAAVGAPALLPVLVAFLFATLVLLTRQIAKEYDPVCLQTVSGLTSTVLLMAAWAVFYSFGFADLQMFRSWQYPDEFVPRRPVRDLLASLHELRRSVCALGHTCADAIYRTPGWLPPSALSSLTSCRTCWRPSGSAFRSARALAMLFFEHRAAKRQNPRRKSFAPGRLAANRLMAGSGGDKEQ